MRVSLSLLLVIAVALPIPCLAIEAAGPGGNAQPAAQIWTYGEVNLNNDPTVSGTTIFSGSTISTTLNSTAVLTVGNAARLELLPFSSLYLEYDKQGVRCKLSSGSVRVAASHEAVTSIATSDGVVTSAPSENSMFTVELANGTSLATFSGRVTISEGSRIQEKRPTAYFRSALAGEAAGNRVNGRKGDTSSLAVTLIGIGAVIAAVTGLFTPRDEGFFVRGGLSKLR
jgi:hypothetical protein